MTALTQEERKEIKSEVAETGGITGAKAHKLILTLKTTERNLHTSRNAHQVTTVKLELVEASLRKLVGCHSCGEDHPPETLCPPFEVRTTGLDAIKPIQWRGRHFDLSEKYKKLEAERDVLAAELEELREALEPFRQWRHTDLENAPDHRIGSWIELGETEVFVSVFASDLKRIQVILSHPPNARGKEVVEKARRWLPLLTPKVETLEAENDRLRETVKRMMKSARSLDAVLASNLNLIPLTDENTRLREEAKDVEAYRKQHKTDWERIKRLREEAKNIEQGDQEIRIADQKAFREKINTQKEMVSRLRKALENLGAIFAFTTWQSQREMMQTIIQAALAAKPEELDEFLRKGTGVEIKQP